MSLKVFQSTSLSLTISFFEAFIALGTMPQEEWPWVDFWALLYNRLHLRVHILDCISDRCVTHILRLLILSHIVDYITTTDPNFCICMQLLSMINAKLRYRPTLPLPYLVTRTRSTLLSQSEFAAYEGDRVLIRSKCTFVSYNAVVP